MAERKYNTENLTPFKPDGEKALSKKPLQLRIDQDLYHAVMSLPQQKRLKLLRQWIKDGMDNLEKDTTQVN
ncbi:MAG: hypothetical protein AAGA80_10120 [Cyanobacteria bacterium P01_F01_bin.143]